jgi:alpha-N-arabinofuranosidase
MKANLHVSQHFEIGEVSPLIFGGFLEHMGRSIYEGVYDPDSPLADERGLRTDVVAALAELELTVVRYPGGNFTSGYHWQDGVGPKELRPTVRELAWQSIETNQFGTDEFIELCRTLNWQPMLSANLGTGTPEEARDWVEYCNAPAGTKYADMRAGNGSDKPFNVPFWCLGNEMDGPWQIGHVPAEQYAIRAQQAAKMMKDVDRGIATVACGTAIPALPTYLEWDRTVLEHLGGLADFISLHRYVGNTHDDTANFLAVSNSIDQQIEAVDACCRYAAERLRLPKRAYLCFDEWNVWYKNRGAEDMDGRGKFAPALIEEVYNLEDALVVAGFLMSFIRHADVVKIANIAQLVNVIGPILTKKDGLLKQSIFYAFRMISSRKGGISLRAKNDSPTYASLNRGEASYLDHAVTFDDGKLNLFLTNRSTIEALEVTINTDMTLGEVISAEILTAEHAKVANDYDRPNEVVARPLNDVKVSGSKVMVTLPPLAFAALTIGGNHD